jgi:hypothetical protein
MYLGCGNSVFGDEVVRARAAYRSTSLVAQVGDLLVSSIHRQFRQLFPHRRNETVRTAQRYRRR